MNMLEQIKDVVRQAGELICCAHHIEEDTLEKNGPSDLVTKYDLAVQAFLRRELLRLLPEAGFLGEEGQTDTLPDTPWIFVVDPIDGTTNFVRNLGYSNISVALVHNGKSEYGVVYNPFREEMYAARRGEGATLNDEPIHVSDYPADHGLALFGSTIYDRELTDRSFAMMRRLYDRCADFRRLASAALDLCQVAAGRAEVFFECRLRPWDVAAGSLILEEAGGVVSTLEGQPLDVLHNTSIFASNTLCSALRLELEEAAQ